jgi:creatinine amidohydrolase
MTHPWRLEELTPEVARQRLALTTTLIVPAGTLESRANHLPLGTDLLILERLADDLSARTGIPRTPSIPFGVRSPRHQGLAGEAAVSRKTLHRLMNELIEAWEEGAGVRGIVILTAHAVDAHLEALAAIRAVGSVRVVDIFGFDFGPLLDASAGSLHGGQLDTSLMLFLHPELIGPGPDLDRLGATPDRGRALYQFLLGQASELCLAQGSDDVGAIR